MTAGSPGRAPGCWALGFCTAMRHKFQEKVSVSDLTTFLYLTRHFLPVHSLTKNSSGVANICHKDAVLPKNHDRTRSSRASCAEPTVLIRFPTSYGRPEGKASLALALKVFTLFLPLSASISLCRATKPSLMELHTCSVSLDTYSGCLCIVSHNFSRANLAASFPPCPSKTAT